MSKETILLKEMKALTEQILEHFTSGSLALMKQYVALEQKINEALNENKGVQEEMPVSIGVSTEKKIASPPDHRIAPQHPPVLDTDVFDMPMPDFVKQKEPELNDMPWDINSEETPF